VVGGVAGAVLAPAARDVGFHAEDRLDPDLERLLVELDRPEQRAVVGEGKRRHAQRGGALQHARDRTGAVEERVVAVVVEVDEVRVRHDQAPVGADPG